MGQKKQNTVLILCTDSYLAGRCSEALCNAVVGRMGLAWTASTRMLARDEVRKKAKISPVAANIFDAMKLRITEDFTVVPKDVTSEDFEKADRVVAVNQATHLPLLQERFPAWADKVEFWEVADSPEALKQIEHEVMDFTARLIRGGERQKAPPPEPAGASVCPAKKEVSKKGTIRVGRETKGRHGKGVTVVFDVPLDASGLAELGTKLKQRLGTGGTVKDGRIEIQGDQRDRIVAELEGMGYRVKRAGG